MDGLPMENVKEAIPSSNSKDIQASYVFKEVPPPVVSSNGTNTSVKKAALYHTSKKFK